MKISARTFFSFVCLSRCVFALYTRHNSRAIFIKLHTHTHTRRHWSGKD